MAPPCFSSADDYGGLFSQIFPATDTQRVIYEGGWTEDLDVRREIVQMSNTTGDRATISFTGFNIQVVGILGPALGDNTILFRIDNDPQDAAASVKCTNATSTANDNEDYDYIPLFDAGVLDLSQGTHTLFITNEGGSFLIHHFEVFGSHDPGIPTSTSNTPLTSDVSTLPPSSNSTRNPSVSNIIPATNPPYGVSSYTPASSINGTPTTIVIQTARMSHGLSKGVLGGIVTGGAFLLLLFVGVALRLRRRHNRVRSFKGMAKIDPIPNIMTACTTTQGIQFPGRLMEPVSPPQVATLRSRKNARPGTSGAFFAPEEGVGVGEDGDEEGEDEDSRHPSDPAVPHFSSTIAEPSIVLDDGPSRSVADIDGQVLVTRTEAKPHSRLAPADLPVQTPPPAASRESERSALDNAAVTRGEDRVQGVGTRVRRLLIEEDSGVRLAGGRLGEARREEVGSGEWEVLPPPYQEY